MFNNICHLLRLSKSITLQTLSLRYILIISTQVKTVTMNLSILNVYTSSFIPVRNPCVPAVQETLKSHSSSSALPTLTSALDGGQWPASRPGRFTLLREPQYPLQGRLVVPRSVLDNWEESKTFSFRIRNAGLLVAKRLREFQFPDIMYDIIVKYLLYLSHCLSGVVEENIRT